MPRGTYEGPVTSQAHRTLLTTEFLVVNAVLFLNYCNIALFFSYQKYLGSLHIDAKWWGFIISVFSLTGLVARPLISAFIREGNSRRWTAWGTAGVAAALLLYGPAVSLDAMIAVRMFHGLSHCVMAAALMAMFVGTIPQGKSGQAFGVVSIVALVPYAVIPPVLDPLEALLGSFPNLLSVSALLMTIVFPILWWTRLEEPTGKVADDRLTAQDILANFRDVSVIVLLAMGLIIWTTFAPVFFFLHEYGDKMGFSRPGLFFTLSTAAEIFVRAAGGRVFDRADKATLLALSAVSTALGFTFLALWTDEEFFLASAILMGLGWGVAMPAVNGLLFDVSAPKLRGLNANMSVQMFQGGLVIGPVFGGMILNGWGYTSLFWSCAGLLIAGALMTMLLNGKAGSRSTKNGRPNP